MPLERGPLLADETLTGARWCRAHSELVDGWLAGLLGQATGGSAAGLALVAVGGYGRSELCPQSDIDVMLLHHRRSDVPEVADRIWYPVWDQGLHLGHSVCTVSQALALAADDLDTATAVLSARHVAGDASLGAQLAVGARRLWQKRSRRWLTELAANVVERQERAGEVAFRLEPDLKDGRGGLRDVQALHWAEAAHRILLDYDELGLNAAYATLLDARVELQRRTGRSTNLLVLEEQDGVASALRLASADALMAGIAAAARVVSWTSDDAWRRVESAVRGPLRLPRRERVLASGIVLRGKEVELGDTTIPAEDPTLLLQVAVAAARHDATIERHSLELLAAGSSPLAEPWPAAARQLLVDLLLAGHPAIRVIEALDQRGAWTHVVAEWDSVRARPQRNAYHRFTVDRHLLETAANAAGLAASVERPDLLVMAGLVHDLGKGCPGDHTHAGVVLAERILTRMGFAPGDVETVTALVEHHLLLADVATRRDLDDPATLEAVAAAVGTVDRLRLLAALTEADSLATGPAAWGPWKAQLVGQLVERVGQVLAGGTARGAVVEPFPTREQLARLAEPGQRISAGDGRVTVMTDDRPGIFSRVAGVLALHGLDVLGAAAHSSDDGRALAEFQVTDPYRDETPWARVVADLERALAGRLAINARLAERARTYRTSQPGRSATPVVTFDNQASAGATVIDVDAADRLGVLYRITRALAELDLDIRSAKVQTLGSRVIDSFYVRDHGGAKVTSADALGEIERAIVHSLTDPSP